MHAQTHRPSTTALALVAFAGVLLGQGLLLVTTTHAQSPSKFEIERARLMLKIIKDDLKKNYYDPNFHGMDVEARFKAADEKLGQASSVGQVYGIVAQVLVDLNDSHTFFFPPQKRDRTDYGWQMQMIGDRCFVVAVKPRSDAEAKNLKPGTEIVSIDGRVLTRENSWLIEYLYHGVRPQFGVRLVVIDPSGQNRQVDVLSEIKPGKQITDLTSGVDLWQLIREGQNEDRLHRHRYVESEDLFIWKMPEFDLEKDKVDDIINKVKKRKNLILDLRGNPGGYLDTLLRLVGNVFDHDVRIGEIKRRTETKPLVAKTRGDGGFSGNLVVLVDSKSGSAAELFARVIQIEKRGKVIGDRTAGAVMLAKSYDHQVGQDIVVFYGASITDADIIMTDGKSLEHAGVIPDEVKLPAPADLASQRDPVLAYAASLLAITITPEKAGSLFPIEWRK